ncbi:hypothetical protein PVNG_06161 [Plasmodium vivax North Korean]|uniref:Variable surface protein Vir21 n=1 Tax=Plasmodium vivax North Korean TaxID=1035514 RepID=A0A0J9U1R6_PLAVI|nr:hypothetical protein PVNG_06161 [Plasmodium vivax North Korean]
MAGNNEIYNLNDFLDGNDKLRLSNLNTFYQSYFDSACDNYVDSYYYCSEDTDLDTLPPHLLQLYRKFVRNLKLMWVDGKTIYDIWEKDKKKLCSYLKYWLYDQLISEKITEKQFTEFFNLWNERKSKKCPKCECEFKIINFSQVKLLKNAFDYSLFLKAYKKTAKINDQIFNKNYCKYIAEAKAIYSLLELRCEKNYTEHCKEFKEYVLPYINYAESKTYEYVEEDEVTEEDENTKEDEDYQKAQLMLKKLAALKEKGQEYNAQLAEAEEDEVPVPKATRDDTARAESPQDNVLPFRSEDRSAGHVLKDTFPGSDGFIHSPGLNTGTEGNGSPTKTIASASLVGVPSIIFLLYKVNKTYIFNY